MSQVDAIESAGELCSGRFQLRRRLGEGGFGVVYAAYDRERGVDVAVKVLTNVDAQALFRFKQEFRSLADVRHPNLIGLQELFSDDDLWFFTMELVNGTRFCDWIRHRDPAVVNDGTKNLRDATTVRNLLDFDDPPEIDAQPIEDDGRLDVARLRGALPQLVEGLAALHAAGKLHCDLKPSNVLVTPEGRLVILDFGLVREVASGKDLAATEGTTAGTPSYMSPEHARGEPLTPASDWYSAGVMLYEALTGHLPFVGSVMMVLTHKMTQEAPAPSEIVPGLPADLESLCIDLVRMEPRSRPTPADIRRRSNAQPGEHAAMERVLVGRESELARLDSAYARAAGGGTTQLIVCGPSGAGKSTLVQCFLDRLTDVCVLASRCYEQESVPYKGIDGLIDALTRRLAGLNERQQQTVLGEDGKTLAQIFPVLRALEPLRRVRTPEVGSKAQRLEACHALKQLLRRLAEIQPIVLFIDDAQWADKDSIAVLDEIFDAKAPPRLMLLCTGREANDMPRAEALQLSMLGEQACRDLARTLLGDDPHIDRIAKEARGDALLLESLCRDVRERGELDTGATTLEAATLRRLDRLEPAARRLFELVACAGTPIDSALLARAAGDERGADVQLADLCARRLLRVRSARAATIVEASHDRVRDVVVSRLPSYALRVHHAALAAVLEQTRGATDELLAVHWQAAGDDSLAAQRYARAAEASERVLAFERAARLYRQALSIAPRSASSQLYARLADALLQSDRPTEARQAFLSAAALARGEETAVFERRAADLTPDRE